MRPHKYRFSDETLYRRPERLIGDYRLIHNHGEQVVVENTYYKRLEVMSTEKFKAMTPFHPVIIEEAHETV